jgi:hypothetical protein
MGRETLLTATLRKGETAELARRERVMPYMTGGFQRCDTLRA